MAIIEEHIKSAKYMMRVTAHLLDDYDEHNEQGRRHLLKSALNNVNQMRQQLFAATIEEINAKRPRYVIGWDKGKERDYWVTSRIHDGILEIIDRGANKHKKVK